jgi:hypothetical protein
MDKKELKKSVQLRFSDIQHMVRKMADAKRSYRAEIEKLAGLVQDFNADYIEKKRDKVERAYRETLQQHATEINNYLECMETEVKQLHAGIDLNDTRWQNAAAIVQSLAGDPEKDGELIRQINAQFAGDQPALRALQSMYRSRGLSYDGGIDKQIYDADSMLRWLRETTGQVAAGTATINALAGRIGKMAALEGVTFDTLPDPEGVMEAARAGAGLVD